MQILKESESWPKLANFWYIDGEFVGPECEVRDGTSYSGRYISCEENHFNSWPKYGGDLASKFTFEHFPRGRVGFDEMTRSFYVIGNPEMVKDNVFQQRVVDRYNLTGKVDFIGDSHYDLP